ncbi:MAG: glutathione S-transferase [Alphaproteobacteria bacterium]|nr:glutathione S-transferase [Alphaproteobacteria bacterium]
MKFYDCSTAPSPRQVRMFIAEKGLTDQIETIEVNLREAEQLGDAFREINPYCTVPVLETDDGTRLTSTAGCCRYLEEAYPEPPLMGRTPSERAVVADMEWRMELDGFLAVGEALRNSAPGLKDRALTGPVNYAQIPELAERGRQRVEHFFTTLDTILEGRDYVAGENFSIADITAFCAVSFANRVKFELPDTADNARRWFAAISERPSAAV